MIQICTGSNEKYKCSSPEKALMIKHNSLRTWKKTCKTQTILWNKREQISSGNRHMEFNDVDVLSPHLPPNKKKKKTHTHKKNHPGIVSNMILFSPFTGAFAVYKVTIIIFCSVLGYYVVLFHGIHMAQYNLQCQESALIKDYCMLYWNTGEKVWD